jgi:hypothetical protein
MNSPHTPQPWEKALSAQHEIIGFVSSEWGRRYFKNWLKDRSDKYGAATSSTSAAAFVNCLPDMMAAEPVYVTGEMEELVYNAMESFNARETVVESDFFLRSAFVYLEEPFVVIDQKGKRVAWRAISWHMEEMTFSTVKDDEEYIEVMTRESAGEKIEVSVKSAIRFVMWSNINDDDDYSHTFHEIDSIVKTNWLVAHALTLPLEDISRTVDTTGDKHSSTLLFVRVMNRLMGERIVTRSRYKAARSLRRHSLRIKLPVNEILVVELRRRTTPSEPTGERRNFSHRFIVHGFWRQQWYPSLGMHRQKYIADYVKGPDDKPLIIKQRIWNWDR